MKGLRYEALSCDPFAGDSSACSNWRALRKHIPPPADMDKQVDNPMEVNDLMNIINFWPDHGGTY